LSYRKSKKKDWIKTLTYIALYVTIISFAAFYLLLSYWYVWIALTVAGLVIVISWHTKVTAYHCPICGFEFEISTLTDFFSPHGVNKNGAWKYLKCPTCSNRSKMEIIVKDTKKPT
jgi:DNA-directed RNA polymerase subunit RPC12/RpoP